MRERLPQRRGHDTIAFEHNGKRYVGSVSFFDDGRPAEVFLNGVKQNTEADTNARDAAIAASLALQFGCPIDTLRRALTRNPGGDAAGPLGMILDLISAPRSDAA